MFLFEKRGQIENANLEDKLRLLWKVEFIMSIRYLEPFDLTVTKINTNTVT